MDIEKYNDHISQGIALMSEQKYEVAKKEFEAAIQIDVKYFLVFLSTLLKPLNTRAFEHLFCKQRFCLMVCLKVLP